MTTQFHALRLNSKITDTVVNFSTNYNVDLDKVDIWTSNMIIVGESRCSEQIHVRAHEAVDLVQAGVYVTVFDTSGDVIETVNIEGVNLEKTTIKCKKTLTYCVLEKNEEGSKMPYSSTYFYTHDKAFSYCEGLETKVKGVYKILSREPLTLGALNIFGAKPFETFCPIREMQQEFTTPKHNVKFQVI